VIGNYQSNDSRRPAAEGILRRREIDKQQKGARSAHASPYRACLAAQDQHHRVTPWRSVSHGRSRTIAAALIAGLGGSYAVTRRLNHPLNDRSLGVEWPSSRAVEPRNRRQMHRHDGRAAHLGGMAQIGCHILVRRRKPHTISSAPNTECIARSAAGTRPEAPCISRTAPPLSDSGTPRTAPWRCGCSPPQP
jgi:hypothetical protein